MDDMDHFVNWEHSGPELTDQNLQGFEIDQGLVDMPDSLPPSFEAELENIGLVLENVCEDDFSFFALQHFTDTSVPIPQDGINTQVLLEGFPDMCPKTTSLGVPASPCMLCITSEAPCKTIPEGRHKGSCTNCVSQVVTCSLQHDGSQQMNIAATAVPPHGSSHLTAESMPLVSVPAFEQHIPTFGSSDFLSLWDGLKEETLMGLSRTAQPSPKIGARFSRESLRMLKSWVAAHTRHPYPSEDEKEILQRQTGLSKLQITNWFANARRRGKVHPRLENSPQFNTHTSSIEIPARRGTPALEAMNPLQRWENSPPENEPASVSAIARAVTESSPARSSVIDSPLSLNYTDDGSGKSFCNGSTESSLGTSQSSRGSLNSTYSHYSHGSHNSWGSLGSGKFGNHQTRRRRRRRTTYKLGADGRTSLAIPLKTFQCTFCTETFRTKHDWQRHEKSLHLSLERWVCTPDGVTALKQNAGQLCCVFCGLENPESAHADSHNHSICKERTLEERTFYRKDHLNQHLKLVHNVKFAEWPMRQWQLATPPIRSRCGFCGITLESWASRVDHLADHFKTGFSMGDWSGGWGFDKQVLDMVENSIPPYLIQDERTSPLPFSASSGATESPRNGYELIKLEVAHFNSNFTEKQGRVADDEEMMLEGCRVIFASELLSLQDIATQASWLRDLLMKSPVISQKARFGPVRGIAENRMAVLKINGKDNLFEHCPMEFQLQEYVKAKHALGLTTLDHELQEEACRIVGRVEEVSTHPSEKTAEWVVRLIQGDSTWLAPFRRRAHLPRSEDINIDFPRSTDPNSIDSTVRSSSCLEADLAEFIADQRARGFEPTDTELQRKARLITYTFDDEWNQTAADSNTWLQSFKQRHAVPYQDVSSTQAPHASVKPTASPCKGGPSRILGISDTRLGAWFLNDTNCYRRLARELSRWVASQMSPNNPQSHVPTDAELQYQARWILYDEDDAWNQTAADNAEWLRRFKHDVGITQDDVPRLPFEDEARRQGFEPPYAFPNPAGQFAKESKGLLEVASDMSQPLGTSIMDGFTSNNQPPAKIFASRKLENGLLGFVKEAQTTFGVFPTDVKIQEKARQLMKSTHTSAEDPVLLQKFKEWAMSQTVATSPTLPTEARQTTGSTSQSRSLTPASVELELLEVEIDDVMQGVSFAGTGSINSREGEVIRSELAPTGDEEVEALFAEWSRLVSQH